MAKFIVISLKPVYRCGFYFYMKYRYGFPVGGLYLTCSYQWFSCAVSWCSILSMHVFLFLARARLKSLKLFMKLSLLGQGLLPAECFLNWILPSCFSSRLFCQWYHESFLVLHDVLMFIIKRIFYLLICQVQIVQLKNNFIVIQIWGFILCNV